MNPIDDAARAGAHDITEYGFDMRKQLDFLLELGGFDTIQIRDNEQTDDPISITLIKNNASVTITANVMLNEHPFLELSHKLVHKSPADTLNDLVRKHGIDKILHTLMKSEL